VEFNLSPARLREALQEVAGTLWVSLEHPTADEVETVLHNIFHFHPLAIEDCQSEGYQSPKLDDFGDYIFIVMHALRPDFPLDQLDTMEFNCFLGSNYVVTSFLSETMPPVQKLWERIQRDQRLLQHGADFLCHALLDELVDEYLPLIDLMEESIDELEDQVLAQPRPDTLQQILGLKHSILVLRRIILPQREVLNRLSRGDTGQIKPERRIYFRDIYDHLVRIHDLSESVRDVVGGALDTYLSVTSNRLNEIMKALTVVSTIFLPLSFVAGVYGMNFQYFPEIRWHYGYLYVWGIFLGIASCMAWWFKRRGWW
jgi:magnesium transporter